MNFKNCSVINFWDCSFFVVCQWGSGETWVFRIGCLGREWEELMKLKPKKERTLDPFHKGISEDVWLYMLENKPICMK